MLSLTPVLLEIRTETVAIYASGLNDAVEFVRHNVWPTLIGAHGIAAGVRHICRRIRDKRGDTK